MSFDLEVRSLCPTDDRTLTEFLDRVDTPSVQGYHYPFYRDALVAARVGEPLYLGAFRGDDLVGVLPCFRSDYGPDAVICSLPVMGPNAGVICSEHDPMFTNIVADLLATLRVAGKSALACSVITPFLFKKFWMYEQFFGAPAVRFREAQFVRLPGFKFSSHRCRVAEAAVTRGVNVAIEPYTLEAEAAYRRACAERVMPVRPGMEEIVKGPASHVKFYVARHEGAIVAGLVCLWGARTASYCQPFATEAGRRVEASTLVTLSAMREAQEAGLVYWHWESNPAGGDGVYRFKRSFGATETFQYATYAHSEHLPLLLQLGSQELARRYPWYYVYPFDALESHAHSVSA